MLVAARLTEGATYLKGFAGLRDSIDASDATARRLLGPRASVPGRRRTIGRRPRRAAAMAERLESRAPASRTPLTTVPIVDLRGDRFGHTDLRGAAAGRVRHVLSNLKPQSADTVRKQITDANDDLAATRAELQKLANVVDETMPELGINLISGSGTIGGALIDVADTVTDLMQRLGLSKPAGASGEAQSDAEEEAAGGTARPASPSRSVRRGPNFIGSSTSLPTRCRDWSRTARFRS